MQFSSGLGFKVERLGSSAPRNTHRPLGAIPGGSPKKAAGGVMGTKGGNTPVPVAIGGAGDVPGHGGVTGAIAPMCAGITKA